MILYKRNLLTGFIVILLALGLFTALIGCDNRAEPPGGVDGLEGALELSADRPSVDFGMVEAEAGSKELSVTLTNTGSEAITVESAVLSDTTNYSLTTETLPLTMEPEATTTVTGTFHPQASGTLEATLSVKAAGIEEERVLTLTGSGNYAPEIVSGYMVLDDGEMDVEGFYTQNGDKNGKPMYKRTSAEDMYLYYVSDPTPQTNIISRATQDEGQGWIVNSSPDIAVYSGVMNGQGPDTDTPEGTQYDGWNSPVVEIIAETKPYIVDENPGLYVGDTLAVYYGYSDKDDDAEGDTIFQWYRQYIESSEWTVISGATSSTYTLQSDDIDCYIRVSVLPKASTGISDGLEAFSDSTTETVTTQQLIAM